MLGGILNVLAISMKREIHSYQPPFQFLYGHISVLCVALFLVNPNLTNHEVKCLRVCDM
jgi:hypothetical protein